MKYYEEFKPSGLTFAEVVGKPDEFHDAMGRIALGFSYLEEMARNVIIFLSGANGEVGRIMTVELSFGQKIHALASLIRYHTSKLPQNDASTKTKEQLRELVVLCQRSEELRNTYFHSSYGLKNTRTKVTSKAKHGLRTSAESVDSGLLLDVAEFIFETGARLRDIPLVLGFANTAYDSGERIRYEKDGQVVASWDAGT